MAIPTLDIIIPVFNRYNETITTLESLQHSRHSKLKLTVVDNGSDSNLRNELIQLYNRKLIDRLFLLDMNYGVSCACNIGWELSTASFFMKLDNDIEVLSDNWIEDIFFMWGQKRYNTIFGPDWNCTKNIGRHVTEHGVYWDMPYSFSGAALLISRKIHNIIGFFNEDYGLYGEEDADYCMRCHHAGIRKYSFDANPILRHNGNNNSMYLEKNIDKALAHNINVGYGKRTGLFGLNLFLYKNKIRDIKVMRKYYIKRIDGINIDVGVNPEYIRWHNSLLECLEIYNNNVENESDDIIKKYFDILR